MQVTRHYWKADLKKWEWVPEENLIKESYVAMEKDFSPKELNHCLKEDKLGILGYLVLGLLTGCVGFLGNWIVGIIMMASIGCFSSLCGFLQYYFNHYRTEYSYYLGEQDGYMYENRLTLIFAEELAQLQDEKLAQEKLAAKWRKQHPLEEKIRLALTGNPNHIAKLLRYCELVKAHSDLKEHIDKTTNTSGNVKSEHTGISVKYINPNNSSKRGKK